LLFLKTLRLQMLILLSYFHLVSWRENQLWI